MLITDKGTEGQMELAEAPWGISALSIHVTEGAAGTLPPPLIICSLWLQGPPALDPYFLCLLPPQACSGL